MRRKPADKMPPRKKSHAKAQDAKMRRRTRDSVNRHLNGNPTCPPSPWNLCARALRDIHVRTQPNQTPDGKPLEQTFRRAKSNTPLKSMANLRSRASTQPTTKQNLAAQTRDAEKSNAKEKCSTRP